MTNPNESAHDAETGAPAEGVTLNEGQTVDAPAEGLTVTVDDSKVVGYHAATHSVCDPYMGENWDGKDGWVKAKLVDDGGEHDEELNVNVVVLDDDK